MKMIIMFVLMFSFAVNAAETDVAEPKNLEGLSKNTSLAYKNGQVKMELKKIFAMFKHSIEAGTDKEEDYQKLYELAVSLQKNESQNEEIKEKKQSAAEALALKRQQYEEAQKRKREASKDLHDSMMKKMEEAKREREAEQRRREWEQRMRELGRR